MNFGINFLVNNYREYIIFTFYLNKILPNHLTFPYGKSGRWFFTILTCCSNPDHNLIEIEIYLFFSLLLIFVVFE